MSKQIKLKRGLDIKLKGKAVEMLAESIKAEKYALKMADFKNITPKLVVKEGERVKAGSTLFYDKYRTSLCFTSPVSGEVLEIKRGERRMILEVIIIADKEIVYEKFDDATKVDISKAQITEVLLKSGLWTTILQRPYGIIANPEVEPKTIHISTFDLSPLSTNLNFALQSEISDFQKGINVLSKFINGKINLNLDARINTNIFDNIKNVDINKFSGPHPAGNVGVQIHHTTPINKGETIWVVNAFHVVQIGKLFSKGIYDAQMTIALAGSEVLEPKYYKIIQGANVEPLLKKRLKEGNNRIISGNVLTGTKIESTGFLSFYDNMITVIPEGNYHEFMGWLAPGFKKFSTYRTFMAWLLPNREYVLDTNMHGGERALVVTGHYEKYLPMDILPMQLIKAILAEDIDKMENLGIYEITEEDFALCEFACTSKTEIQEIIRKGINLMIKEMN